MPPASGAAGPVRDEPHLRGVLQAVLGDQRRVCAVRQRRSPLAGVWPADTVTVELERGGSVALWVKRFMPDGDGHPDKSVPSREPRVYAELLAGEELPVPHCYGCATDPHSGEHLLLLEHVRDWDLRYHGLDTWEVAVRALARLHRRFATGGDDLRRLDFLVRLDADYIQ